MELKTFNLADLRDRESQNHTEVKQAFNSYVEKIDNKIKNINQGERLDINFTHILDSKAQIEGQSFVDEVARGFSREFGLKSKNAIKFNLIDSDKIKAQYDVTLAGGTLASTIGTDILPTIEMFIRDFDPIISKINVITKKPNENVRLWDFDEEAIAANLTEVQTGSDIDDVPRSGDLLLASTKIQASTKISELALSTMDGVEYGIFLSRLVRRTMMLLAVNIVQAGNAVAAGTARSAGTIRGIVNNYGVSGTGDTVNAIGAISYTTKALADAALTAAGVGNSTDAYDLCVKAKRGLLPSNTTEVEEGDYEFYCSRNTWARISTVLDLNGRYKSHSAIESATGKPVMQVDGTQVNLVSSLIVPDGFVLLAPLKLYTLVKTGELLNLNDGGIVQLREGLVSFVSRIIVDGSMRYGNKYKRTTAVTAGTTASDNTDQNAFRYFRIT